MLFTVLINTEALEVDVPPWTKLWLDGTRLIDWRFHAKLLHSILHDGEFESDNARHFDCAAKGDFSVTLCAQC
jgi:hypothetical protein